jgi:hypothetical protein
MFSPMLPKYPDPGEMPPSNYAWTLEKEKKEFIKSALQGGHPYPVIKDWAEMEFGHKILKANEEYKRKHAEYEAREVNKPVKADTWIFRWIP